MNNESHRYLSPDSRQILLQVVRQAIRYRLETSTALPVEIQEYPMELQAVRASFVTLNRHSMLRGCIGHLEAIRPLVADVAENAESAAFQDPRFPPMTRDELTDLEIHISVLTPSERLQCGSEADLLQQMQPHRDGLILLEGMHRGTFLPSVWEQLPEPRDFLRHLKRKAGLPENYWSENIEVFRYETESFS